MNQSTKSIVLWGAIILGIVAMVWGLASLGSGDGSTATTTLNNGITDTDHVQGPRDAKMVLVEYSDFECPACAAMYPVVKQLAETFPNDLAVVYRHYPLRSIHANAQLAAQATEAAARQASFWEMHDVIFNTQTQWENLQDPTDFFVSLASSIGLDTEQFQADLTSKEVENIVNDSYNEAYGMRLSGTPTFFLNGESIQNPGSYQGFKDLVQSAIDAQ